MLKDPAGKELKTEWKRSKPDEVEVKLPLQDTQPGAMTLLVAQYGLAQPQPLSVQSFAEAGRFDGFEIHAGRRSGNPHGKPARRGGESLAQEHRVHAGRAVAASGRRRAAHDGEGRWERGGLETGARSSRQGHAQGRPGAARDRDRGCGASQGRLDRQERAAVGAQRRQQHPACPIRASCRRTPRWCSPFERRYRRFSAARRASTWPPSTMPSMPP